MTVRVAMWSGPRNISTAMMRSFGARPDTVVVDEPFYAYYLLRRYFEDIEGILDWISDPGATPEQRALNRGQFAGVLATLRRAVRALPPEDPRPVDGR